MLLVILIKVQGQEITDNSDGNKIQFTYEPEKPIIDTFTKLYFSVQDLE